MRATHTYCTGHRANEFGDVARVLFCFISWIISHDEKSRWTKELAFRTSHVLEFDSVEHLTMFICSFPSVTVLASWKGCLGTKRLMN